MSKIRLEEITKELEESNWKMISSEYTNLDAELIVQCEEGHSVYTNWRKLRVKKECPICKSNVHKEPDTKIIPKKKGDIRILALDQSTNVTGWSVFENKKLIKYGTFTAKGDNEIARDHQLKTWLISMVEMWEPNLVAIEGIQLQDNSGKKIGVTVFETLARLQGILMEACFNLDVTYRICPTNTWRAHCAVKGRSRNEKKRSMQLIAKKLYDITISDDEADAIGIGKFAAEGFAPDVKTTNWA